MDFVFQKNSPDEYNGQGGMMMGLLSYEDTSMEAELRCIPYSVSQIEAFDVYFHAARGCAVVANIVIGITALFLICMSFVTVPVQAIKFFSMALLAGGMAEAFTLLVFRSDFSCKHCQFSFGAGLALLCSVVSVINGIILFYISKRSGSKDVNARNQSKKKKNVKRPGTPRIFRSKSSASSEEIITPERLKAYDKEVVLVLPDGSKQIIDTHLSAPCCGAGFNLFPCHT